MEPGSADVDPLDVAATGQLWMRTRVLRAWRRRIAVLHASGCLTLYRPPVSELGDAAARGLALHALHPDALLPSREEVVVEYWLGVDMHVERTPDSSRGPFYSFVLVGPGLRAHLASESKEEAARWAQLIGARCGNKEETAPETPPSAAPPESAKEERTSGERGFWYDGPPSMHRRSASGGMRYVWPHTSAPSAAHSGGGHVAGATSEPSTVLLETARQLEPDALAELREWPHMHSAVLRALRMRRALAEGDNGLEAEAGGEWVLVQPAAAIRRWVRRDGVEQRGTRVWVRTAEGRCRRLLCSRRRTTAALYCAAAAALAATAPPPDTLREVLAAAAAVVSELLNATAGTDAAASTGIVWSESLDWISPAAVFAAVLIAAALSFILARAYVQPLGSLALRTRHTCDEMPRQVLADAGSLLPSRCAWDATFVCGRVLRRSGRHSMHVQHLTRDRSRRTREIVVQRFEAKTVDGGTLLVCIGSTYDAHTPPVDGVPRMECFEYSLVASAVAPGLRGTAAGQSHGCVVVQHLSMAPRCRAETELAMAHVLALPQLHGLKQSAARPLEPSVGRPLLPSASSESTDDAAFTDEAVDAARQAAAKDATNGGVRSLWGWRPGWRDADEAQLVGSSESENSSGRRSSGGERQRRGRRSNRGRSSKWPAPRSLGEWEAGALSPWAPQSMSGTPSREGSTPSEAGAVDSLIARAIRLPLTRTPTSNNGPTGAGGATLAQLDAAAAAVELTLAVARRLLPLVAAACLVLALLGPS